MRLWLYWICAVINGFALILNLADGARWQTVSCSFFAGWFLYAALRETAEAAR